MKTLVIILIVAVLISCGSKRLSERDQTLNYSTVVFDSLTFKKLILENDKLLGIVPIALSDREKSKRLNEMMKQDSVRVKFYQWAKFTIEKDHKCKGFRHLYISKKEPYNSATSEQINADFLVIINDLGNVQTTEKLREESFYSDGCITNDSIVWAIDTDSVIRISRYQVECSDVMVDGHEPNCVRKRSNKNLRISCDGLNLISADSTGWEKF